MKQIHLRNVPPPAETFDHPAFFDFIFSYLKPENYLELGVRDGRNVLAISKHCKNVTAVDIEPQAFPSPNVGLDSFSYYKMTTDEFFQTIDKNIKYDAVFIDADHSHEQSLKDFMNVKDMIIEDGFIFFHDTYPFDEEFFSPYACNDVYKTALYIKENLIDDFEIVTLPFNPGITIVKKMKRNKQLIYIDNLK
jgi:predicted O-methyltransferase YrrM